MKKVITLDHIMAVCKTLFSRITSYISSPIILQTRKSIPYFQQQANLKIKEFEKLEIPLPPKRPLNSFLRFTEMTLPKLRAENPEKTRSELYKLLSMEWEKCPADRKESIKKDAEDALISYKEEKEKYVKSLTPQDIQNITEAKEKAKQKKLSVTRKKKILVLEKPTRSPSSYALYIRDKKNTLSPENRRHIIKQLADSWKKESFDVKHKYEMESKKLKVAYKKDLYEWEQKMIELGHLDVLGTKALRKLHKKYEKEESNPTSSEM